MAHPVLEFLMATKMPRHLDKTNKDDEQLAIEFELWRCSIIAFNKAWADKSIELVAQLNTHNISFDIGVGQRCSVLEIVMVEVRTITNHEFINELTKQIKGI